MKKILIVLILFCLAYTSFARIFEVPTRYPDIATALNDPAISPGDTIGIERGSDLRGLMNVGLTAIDISFIAIGNGGANPTITPPLGFNGPVLTLRSSSNSNSIRIIDINITGSTSSLSTIDGLFFDNVFNSYIEIKNCNFSLLRTAIKAEVTNPNISSTILIKNNLIERCFDRAIVAELARSCALIVTDNLFSRNGAILAKGADLFVASSGKYGIASVVMLNNTVTTNGTYNSISLDFSKGESFYIKDIAGSVVLENNNFVDYRYKKSLVLINLYPDAPNSFADIRHNIIFNNLYYFQVGTSQPTTNSAITLENFRTNPTSTFAEIEANIVRSSPLSSLPAEITAVPIDVQPPNPNLILLSNNNLSSDVNLSNFTVQVPNDIDVAPKFVIDPGTAAAADYHIKYDSPDRNKVALANSSSYQFDIDNLKRGHAQLPPNPDDRGSSEARNCTLYLNGVNPNKNVSPGDMFEIRMSGDIGGDASIIVGTPLDTPVSTNFGKLKIDDSFPFFVIPVGTFDQSGIKIISLNVPLRTPSFKLGFQAVIVTAGVPELKNSSNVHIR